MNVIHLPDDLPGHVPVATDDVLVTRHAMATSISSLAESLATARRRVVLEMVEHDDCLTIAELRARLADIDHLIPMLLGELQTEAIVDKHMPDDGTTAMHYFLTNKGERFAEAN